MVEKFVKCFCRSVKMQKALQLMFLHRIPPPPGVLYVTSRRSLQTLAERCNIIEEIKHKAILYQLN